MPAYSPDVLSDAQLRDIYEFVRSIPAPPALEEISKLDFE
jgi:mono/diheme cytochrome c family protein